MEVTIKLSGLEWFVVLWLATTWGFVLMSAAVHAYRAGTLTLFWKIHLVPLAIVFIVLDATFNTVFGTVMFLEVPRIYLATLPIWRLRIPIPYPALFTWHCDQHLGETGWRGRIARFWCRQMAVFDPGHCHGP